MDKPPHLDLAVEACKQILTLATGILVLTLTFAKDTFIKDRQGVPTALRLSWLCYLFSILGGVWTLFALTGEFAMNAAKADIYKGNVGFPAAVMLAFFVAGLVLTVIAGWQATGGPKKRAPAETPPDDLAGG